MENNFTDRHGNPLFQIMPQTPTDTLMACFSLSFYSSESLANRIKIRNILLKRFKKIIFAEEDQLNPNCHLHPAVRAFVNRLQLQHPNISKSAEKCLISFPTLLIEEANVFLQKNGQVGFITDRYVFSYLAADVFHVKINIDDNVLSINDEDYYEIYLHYTSEHKFILLQPCIKLNRMTYQGMKLLKEPLSRSKIVNGIYELKGIGYLAPPKIKGYKVHAYTFYSMPKLQLYILKARKDCVYVFDGEIWMGYGKEDVYFYLSEGNHYIFAVKAKTYEEAHQAIIMEF